MRDNVTVLVVYGVSVLSVVLLSFLQLSGNRFVGRDELALAQVDQAVENLVSTIGIAEPPSEYPLIMYDPELELYVQVVKPAQNKLIEMGPRVVPYLVRRLLSSQNDATKKSLLIILARIRDARAVSAVRAIVRNPAHSESVRATAAWALRFFPSTENVDILIDVLASMHLETVKTYWVKIYKEPHGSVPVSSEMLAQTLRGMRVSMWVTWEPPDGLEPFLDLQIFYTVDEICYKLSIFPSPPPTYCDWSGEEVPIEEKEKVRMAWISWWHCTRKNIR